MPNLSNLGSTFGAPLTIMGVDIRTGTGAPAFSASKGTLYIRLDGSSTSTRMYICQTANTATSGAWTNFTTAA